MFSAVLIANRGEIALRVARACRELGVRTVMVHSTADRDSPALRLADECVHIGPAPSRRSYLYPPAILEAALRTGVDARSIPATASSPRIPISPRCARRRDSFSSARPHT
ncbi:biotin carboxylase N-terminal domain-containing protein [Fodinicola feengrottensis]|uniref:biotin carboxylase N-terminal domain-containing protein n=1 Tax=Fodinicola feengrottensis TaxID=435914 RepID=UPI00244179AA|nr:biotin carboxylase N-terminal domain-containing protein [Fodinicola feengrottensis]